MDGLAPAEVIVRNHINGTLLTQNVGKPVCIIGSIIKMNPSNNGFDIQTTDNLVVNIRCNEMISEAVDGLVEIRGTPEGKNAVSCDNYIQFPPELAKTFDAEKHNEGVMILNTVQNALRP